MKLILAVTAASGAVYARQTAERDFNLARFAQATVDVYQRTLGGH